MPASQRRTAPSRWTCSATRYGPRASTPATSTTTSRPAYATTDRTRQLRARPEEGRRARRLEARPPRPQPRPPGQHRAEPVGPRRGPAGAHRARRADATAAGRLVFGTFAALAEFERELIRERTLAGLTAARARRRHGGRTFALSKVQVRLAQAAMAHRDTSVSALCRELGITPRDALPVRRAAGPVARARREGARPVNRSALDLNRADHHAATGAHSQPAGRCSRPVGKAGADGLVA